MAKIAILGGTGPEGIGLAMRLVSAGESVWIGSRSRERAALAAKRVLSAVPGAQVAAGLNSEVAALGEVVAICVPFAGLDEVVAESAASLAGKVVLDVVNPLERKNGAFLPRVVPEGSAGARVARLVPGARVVSALKTLSAEHLQELAKPLEGDVFLCSDDPDAKAFVAEIVSRLVNLRPLDAGPLRLGAVVEGITALLLNLNRRYKAVTSVRILGLEHVTRSR